MTLYRNAHTAMIVTLESLIRALSAVNDRYGDQAMVELNHQGNLAIRTPDGENQDRTPSPNGVGRFYVGYIDMGAEDGGTAMLVWENDLKSEQNPSAHPLTQIWAEREDVHAETN